MKKKQAKQLLNDNNKILRMSQLIEIQVLILNYIDNLTLRKRLYFLRALDNEGLRFGSIIDVKISLSSIINKNYYRLIFNLIEEFDNETTN